MHDHPPQVRSFLPSPQNGQADLWQAVAANPLADTLKRSILEELLGGPSLAYPCLQATGLDRAAARSLTPHESATLDAVTGRSLDIGARSLLEAVRRSRGAELLAWADLASVATRVRVGAAT